MRQVASSAALALLIVACGARDQAHQDIGRASSAIIGGTDSPSSEDYVVYVLNPPDHCTGTIIAPKLVLTARHCAGATVNEAIGNDQSTCRLQGQVSAAQNFQVSVGAGGAHPFTATVAVTRVFADLTVNTCDNDIVALELKDPIPNIPLHALQLDAPAQKDEAITSIGYGFVDDDGGGTQSRQHGTGVVLSLNDKGEIDQGGQTATPTGSPVTVPAGYVLTSSRTCGGDSGSPLIRSSTGDILAVNHGYLAGADALEGHCSDSVSVYIPLWTHRDFIERVFETQGIMPTRVGRSAPADVGGKCKQNNECNSNYCVLVGPDGGQEGTCSHPCTKKEDCAAPLECTDTGSGYSVCLAPFPAPSDSSCDVSSSSQNGALASGLVVFLACMFAQRRRRLSDR